MALSTPRPSWHVEAHDQMLQQLCRKWGGSHELMHELAAKTVAQMPAGSPLGRLTATAHLEHWLDLRRDEGAAYLGSAEVRADLNAAADRSVRHPHYQRRPGWPATHNSFAMAFSMAGEWAAAAEQFDAIGPLMTERPWQYVLFPRRRFRKLRDRARAEASR